MLLDINDIPMPLLMAKNDLKIYAVNKSCYKLFGYTDQELLGRGVDILIPLKSRDLHNQEAEKYLKNPVHRRLGGTTHLYGEKKGGDIVPLEIELHPFGEYIMVLIIDTSAWQQEIIYKSILNSIPNGIYVVDVSGKIIFFNNEIVAMLGSQVLGERLEDRGQDYGFYLPDQKTIWPANQLPLVRVLKNGNMNGGIMFIRNASKPEGLWITNFAYPLRDVNGTMVGAVAILKEIVNSANVGLPTIGTNVPPLPL